MQITLLDGRTADTSHILFDPVTYRFSADTTGEDLTLKIRLTDKERFAGFDRDRWFTISSDLRNTGTIQPELDTSTFSNFWTLITTDPLGAPLEQLNKAVDKFIAAPAIKKIFVGAVIVGGLYLLIKQKKP